MEKDNNRLDESLLLIGRRLLFGIGGVEKNLIGAERELKSVLQNSHSKDTASLAYLYLGYLYSLTDNSKRNTAIAKYYFEEAKNFATPETLNCLFRINSNDLSLIEEDENKSQTL